MTVDAVGGVWTYVMELAQGLAERGMVITLATTGVSLRPDQRDAVTAIPSLTLHESKLSADSPDEPWRKSSALGKWLLDLATEIRPDIIHLNDYSYAALPWPAPVLVVGHSCVYSWFEAVKRIRPPVEWDSYRRKVIQGLKAAQGVTAPTHAMLSTMQKHYGGFHALRCIYHARQSGQFTPLKKEPFIFSAGRLWDEAKNLVALDRVTSRLAWPVYLAGDDRDPEGHVTQLSGAKKVGRLNERDLAHWMARAAIFSVPARYQPFGLAALEAGLSGCALVLGDIPSLREVWNDAACFVPPDDDSSLRDCLTVLIEDEQQLAAMGAAARARALEFTPKRMVDEYLRAYEELREQSVSAPAQQSNPTSPLPIQQEQIVTL